jgi:uncharacterized membrane protein
MSISWKGTVRTRVAWDRMRVNFWFTPLIMSVLAVLLAWMLGWVDAQIPNEMLWVSRLVKIGDVAETRMFLINLGSTLLVTAGVVFSLLMVPLSAMASQYGSRLLRHFMGDRTTQFVLGMFVSTFVYCWAVAESLPLVAENWEMPQLALTAAVLLLLASFASIIMLITHFSTMMQAPTIAAEAGAELLDAVRAGAPAGTRSGTHPGSSGTLPDPPMETEGFPVRVMKYGYIQYIDPDHLFALGRKKDIVIDLRRKTGHFVGPGDVVARVWPPGRVDARLEGQIRQAFHVGKRRSPTQDVGYAVSLLAEMALRAMSPAINDPYTAITCLDYLGEGLALFLRQGETGSRYYDPDGRLRIVLEPVSFDEMAGASFDLLRHAGRDTAPVLQQMLDVIAVISQEAASPGARASLLRQVCLIQEEVRSSNLIEEDRRSIGRSADLVKTTLTCPT